MMNVEDIVEENNRRRALILAENEADRFDPVTGRNSVGKRFQLSDSNKSLWLPLAMIDLPIVKEIESRGFTPLLEARLDRERLLHDFPYWAATRAFIKRKGGGDDILFHLNRPQRKLVAALEDMRINNLPIRLILLKARQWGGSTCVQLYMAWLQLVHSTGLNSLIVAHQGVATEEIKDMFDRVIEGVNRERPDEALTMKTVGKSRSSFRIVERNCKVKVGSAERPDSCRGGDYSLVHCSEVGIWKTTLGKSPESMIRSACSGVLLRPMTMIVYESTANGTGNFFHREYEAARDGDSQFRPLFVAWFEIDQYSAPINDTSAFAAELLAGKDVATSTSDRREPGRYLWWLWEKGATLEAINWYISERLKYSDHGMMASEYPSDDIEAFVHSGARVFDKYKVEALRAGCRIAPEFGEIDVRMDGIPFNPAVASVEYRRDALERVQFIALKSGGWKVWRRPELGFRDRYVVCVDVGGRSDKADWSVIVVFDRVPILDGYGPEVVAQWRGHTDFDILAWKAALAAKYYDNALLVIESNTLETHDNERIIDGDQSCTLLSQLRLVYDNLYMRRQSPEDIALRRVGHYGFHTNTSTKPMVIASLVTVIREGLYTERDAACLDEYLAYERRPNGSFGAITGCHDDLLMTRAIGLHICFHEMDRPQQCNNPYSNSGGIRAYRRPDTYGYSF